MASSWCSHGVLMVFPGLGFQSEVGAVLKYVGLWIRSPAEGGSMWYRIKVWVLKSVGLWIRSPAEGGSMWYRIKVWVLKSVGLWIRSPAEGGSMWYRIKVWILNVVHTFAQALWKMFFLCVQKTKHLSGHCGDCCSC